MRILLTGVTGYVGKRLLPVLIENGHEIIVCVREKSRLTIHKNLLQKVQIVEIDFLKTALPDNFPKDIDSAYYLIHSMTTSSERFDLLESEAALNFKTIIEKTSAKQVIYLSGISKESKLSKNLQSRREVTESVRSLKLKKNYHKQ